MSETRSKSLSRSPGKRRGSPGANPESLCPFLVRIFVTKGRHTSMGEFDTNRLPIRDEFQVYAWKHSTPTSLVQLLLPSFPPTYRSPMARFSFRHIYVDASPRGLYRSRDLVSFSGRDLMASTAETKVSAVAMDMELDNTDIPRRGSKIEEKTLEEYGYITGDLISVSLHIPEPKIPAGRPSLPEPGVTNGVMGAAGKSFGWGEPASRDGQDRHGVWGRGEPLPPQNNARPIRGGLAIGDGGAGGSWRGGGAGAGGRGGSRRSRSPARHGDRRSRSPVDTGRRESWNRRRD